LALKAIAKNPTARDETRKLATAEILKRSAKE